MKKHLHILLSITIGIGFLTSCHNEEELHTPISDTTPHSVVAPLTLDFDNSYFPKANRSYGMQNSPTTNFNYLIQKVEKQRLLDGSHLQISTDQAEEIKLATEEILHQQTLRTQYDTLRLLNTWCHDNIRYDQSDNNAYACFKGRKGVCYGYSNLLRAMLLSQGIPTINVIGTYVGAGAHAWCYVYADNKWYVADPTNHGLFEMRNTNLYEHLQAEQSDLTLFSDENFDYDYYESHLNISRVKQAAERITIPYSVAGLRITMCNPHSAIPQQVRHLYIGQNIRSLGVSIQGLSQYPAQDEMVFVDTKNSLLTSENGIVYNKSGNKITSINYLPMGMKSATLHPFATLEKNIIVSHPMLEEIVVQTGTKQIEAYAFENLPALRRIYLPKDCTADSNSLYNCPANVQIFTGTPTAIVRVRK